MVKNYKKVFLNARTLDAFKVRKVELFLKLVFSGLLLFLFLLSKVFVAAFKHELWVAFPHSALLTLEYMLHRLPGGDIRPSPLQSQNPKSNQVTGVLGEGPGSSSAKEDVGKKLHKG